MNHERLLRWLCPCNDRKLLRRLGACPDALKWYGFRDSQRAWFRCERGDWLLWIAAKIGVDRRVIVEAACDCAEMVLCHVSAGDEWPKTAIDAARAWCRGEASIETVTHAAAKVAAYAAGCTADCAAYAAHAAKASAYAASNAPCLASVVVDASLAASYAADSAKAAKAATRATGAVTRAARDETFRRCAELTRARIPWSLMQEGIVKTKRNER